MQIEESGPANLTPELRRGAALLAWYRVLNDDAGFRAGLVVFEQEIGEKLRSTGLDGGLLGRIEDWALEHHVPTDRWRDVENALLEHGPIRWTGVASYIPEIVEIHPSLGPAQYDVARETPARFRERRRKDYELSLQAEVGRAHEVAEKASRTNGIRPLGARRRSERDLMTAARRLYRLRVCGWSAGQIVAQESISADGVLVDESTIRKTAADFAAELKLRP